MSLRILLQSPFISEMRLIEVPEGSDFEAVCRAALDAIPEEHRSAENDVTVEGDDEKEGHGKPKVKDGMRVHVGRCKKASVTVRFMGDTKSHEFPPASRIRRVKDWAVKEFRVAEAEAARHGLYIPGSEQELSADVHIGTLVQACTCGVTLDLLPTDRIHGA
ncbi:MAG: hypothetical protein JSR75_19825 [Proteobacteria bacterium]|nr:hypothetical protein [Pseudomonadota bacterium]